MNKNYLISGFADEIDQDLTTQIENLQKLNMHYVEMRGVDGNNLIYHTDEKVKEIKERLDGAGISLSALGSPLGKIGIEDPFEKHFEEFKRAVEIAHRMDAKNIRMFSFYVPEGQGAQYKEQVFDRLGQFVDYAKANDAVLLHEN
ncbi:MAG: TIM barrel protein, partial [Lachnospiraceae bacterium]|nr:TIM barrel protein [Lachnospiraceae bacterium]